MSRPKIVEKEKIAEKGSPVVNVEFEFDFAMCHGSYFYCG